MASLSHILALAAVLGTAGSALAQQVQTASCQAAGRSYQVGDSACIPGCYGRQRYARCDGSAGSASWTTISDTCPTVLQTPLPPGSPVRPVMMACTFPSPFAQFN